MVNLLALFSPAVFSKWSVKKVGIILIEKSYPSSSMLETTAYSMEQSLCNAYRTNRVFPFTIRCTIRMLRAEKKFVLPCSNIAGKGAVAMLLPQGGRGTSSPLLRCVSVCKANGRGNPSPTAKQTVNSQYDGYSKGRPMAAPTASVYHVSRGKSLFGRVVRSRGKAPVFYVSRGDAFVFSSQPHRGEGVQRTRPLVRGTGAA